MVASDKFIQHLVKVCRETRAVKNEEGFFEVQGGVINLEVTKFTELPRPVLEALEHVRTSHLKVNFFTD